VDRFWIAPQGEIDFLILHPTLGALTLEVKAGIYEVQGSLFTLVHTGQRVDIAAQMRHNTHGLARWLGGAGIRWKIGYGWVFTDSSLANSHLPPAITDLSCDPTERIALDCSDMPNLGERIQQVMAHWKRALGNPDLGATRLQQIRDALWF